MKILSVAVLIAAIAGRSATAQIRVLAVTDAATFTSGLPYYGSLASVFCTGLTGIGGVQAAAQYPLPYEIAGVSVTVSGAAAPVLAVADFGTYQQINIQVPETADASQTLMVSQSGQSGETNWSPQSGAGPSGAMWGVFFAHSSGNVIAQHTDYSLITPEHPAQPGEAVIVYGTNLDNILNVVSPPPLGSPAQANPLPTIILSNRPSGIPAPFITLDGESVPMIYEGLTPGLVGVFQVNFQVPATITSGNAMLAAVVGSYYTCYGFGLCTLVPAHTSLSAILPVSASGSAQ
jgi:uncharacterized protein (TIGR03437 family)